jgi:hypothetical protein
MNVSQRTSQGCLKGILAPGHSGPNLLMIDQLGYLPFSRQQHQPFVSGDFPALRHGSIITSNLPLPQSGSALGN